jgi:glycosyltransferase involved in cell wall biosynthesis
VLPHVWARRPDIACWIAGADWPEPTPWPAHPQVRVLGALDDLAPLLGAVRLTVAPLRFGAGIKGKVLDSLAAGVAVAMTPVAAEGLALRGALTEAVGGDAEALAGVILRLYHDEGFSTACVRAGLDLLASDFTAERTQAALAEAIADSPPTEATQATAAAAG